MQKNVDIISNNHSNNGVKQAEPTIFYEKFGQIQGHQYVPVTSLKWRVIDFIQALALTILTCGIGLCFPYVRQLWKDALFVKKIKPGTSGPLKYVSIDIPVSNPMSNPISTKNNSNSLTPNSQTIPLPKKGTTEIIKKNKAPTLEIPSLPNFPNSLAATLADPTQVPFATDIANELFKNALKSAWFSFKHLPPLVHITELDLTEAFYPIQEELIELILSDCKEIKSVKLAIKQNQGLLGITPKSNLLNEAQVFTYILKKPKDILDLIQISDVQNKKILLDLSVEEGINLFQILRQTPDQVLPLFEPLYISVKNYTGKISSAKKILKGIFDKINIEEFTFYLSQLIKLHGSEFLEKSDFFNLFEKDKLKEMIKFAFNENADNLNQLIQSIFDAFSDEDEKKEWISTFIQESSQNPDLLAALTTYQKCLGDS